MDVELGLQHGSLDLTIVDDGGKAILGIVAATCAPLYWSLAGPNASVAIGPLVDLASETDPWTENGFIAREDGGYRWDYPDVLAANFGSVTIRGEAANQHVLAPILQVGITANPRGEGPTLVNHDFGGLGNLRVLNSSGGGVAGAAIRAYLLSDYNAGLTDAAHIVGQTSTDSSGNWVSPLMPSPGYTYMLVISQPNFYQTSLRQISV